MKRRKALVMSGSVEARGWMNGYDLLECRDGETLAAKRKRASVGGKSIPGVQGAQIRQQQVPHPAEAIGRTVHALVVVADEHTIACRVHVGFQVAHAEVESASKGDQGVLGCEGGAAAVRKQQRRTSKKHPGWSHAVHHTGIRAWEADGAPTDRWAPRERGAARHVRCFITRTKRCGSRGASERSVCRCRGSPCEERPNP